MAKTLVIKGADFSVNKIETVSFGEIPCTGISLDASETISGLGTVTLVPVVTPANTTDPVRWSSSDTDVATVVGGVVTAHRYGTVNITATCGEYSVTCAITISILFAYAKNTSAYVSATSSNLIDAIPGALYTNNRYISMGAPEQAGVYPVVCYYDTGDIANIYPIPIPEGAKTLTINMKGFACVFAWLLKGVKSAAALQQRVRDSATVIDGETPSGGTPWSISSWTYDTRTVSIPESADSVSLTLFTINSTTFDNFSPNNISITFGYE